MITPRVWAPAAESVELVTAGGRSPMQLDGEWWSADVALNHGDDYGFAIDGGEPRPDPRSLWQPHGVHGLSRCYDHDVFTWSDEGWTGTGLDAAVLYELHVGTFTPTGTFDAAIERLDHLMSLGITIVEVMPVGSWDGDAGWGYDGVCLFATHEPYGGPDGLKRFVNACHARGLAVVLDVVYNHLGPSGNYLAEFGPYFTDSHQTPWGPAVNLDAAGSNEVRSWIVDNAASWLRDFHLDGLRLDAVHALQDDRALTLLEELSGFVDLHSDLTQCPKLVIAESDRNDPRTVINRQDNGIGMHAQWADDVHHALHAWLTGERQGYYCDFGSYDTLAKALTGVFVHDGSWSTFRGHDHGRPVDTKVLSGNRFVTFLQNHDQIGNRALGDRLSASLSDGQLRIGAALLFTSACVPQLFMGEEWGASTPWQFFTSFPDPELAAAVSTGRAAEFSRHGWPASEIPDPQSPSTLARSKLRWSELDELKHVETLSWYRELIALRRELPGLRDGRLDLVDCDYDQAEQWFVVRRPGVAVVCNLAPTGQTVPITGATEILLSSAAADLSPGTVQLPAESVAIVAL